MPAPVQGFGRLPAAARSEDGVGEGDASAHKGDESHLELIAAGSGPTPSSDNAASPQARDRGAPRRRTRRRSAVAGARDPAIPRPRPAAGGLYVPHTPVACDDSGVHSVGLDQ